MLDSHADRHAAARAKIHGVDVPAPAELIERIQALPAARPLRERLADVPGLYVVGGAVRDLLLGREPRELDLVVEGDAAAVASRLGGSRRVHDRFGTVTVTLDGRTYDIARARKETYSRPGALPDVEPARLEDDLWRRDFSVNAGAVALTGERAGELRAVPAMLADLDARVLRVLHDASFVDDPTRMLRLTRYAARLGFSAEPHTRALLDQAVRGDALATVSAPRIGAELRLLSREPDAVGGFRVLHELGLDQPLGLDAGRGAMDLAERALVLLPIDQRHDRLVLAAAARGRRSDDELRGRLDAWGFVAPDREAIAAAAAGADELATRLTAAARPSEIAAAAKGAPDELVALAGALGPDQPAGEWLARLREVRLEIDGEDLLAAGVPAGPAIGRGLQAALADKLDGRALTRSEQLASALRAAGQLGSG
jgi:tRNA nucleotidyltransferase (CCA-adding enzyme)